MATGTRAFVPQIPSPANRLHVMNFRCRLVRSSGRAYFRHVVAALSQTGRLADGATPDASIRQTGAAQVARSQWGLWGKFLNVTWTRPYYGLIISGGRPFGPLDDGLKLRDL